MRIPSVFKFLLKGEARVEDLKSRLDASECLQAEANRRLEAENNRLRSQLEETIANNKVFRSEFDQARKEIVSGLTSEAEWTRNEIGRLKADVASEFDQSKAEASSKLTSEIDKLVAQNNKLRSELDQSRSEIATRFTSEFGQLRFENGVESDRLRTKMENIVVENKVLHSEFDQLRNEIVSTLTSEFNRLRGEVTLKPEADRLRLEVDKIIAKIKAFESEMRAEVVSLRADIAATFTSTPAPASAPTPAPLPQDSPTSARDRLEAWQAAMKVREEIRNRPSPAVIRDVKQHGLIGPSEQIYEEE